MSLIRPPSRARRRRAALSLSVGVLLTLLLGGAAAKARPEQGQGSPGWLMGATLAEVERQHVSLLSIESCEGVRCTDRSFLEQIESLSDLHTGALLRPGLLKRSRRNLMATGYFEDVRYVVAPGTAGVDVALHLRGRVFVDRVRVEVDEWFPSVFQREILQRLTYRPGRALDPDPVVRTRQEETIRRLYERQGFEGTEVSISWTIADHRAQVLVHISEGRGHRLRKVRVRGNTHLSTDEIAQVFAGKLNLSGSSLWGATLVRSLTREIREEREAELMRSYQEEGFFEVAVRSRVEKDVAAGAIDLWVDVDEGPRYRVEIEGNEAIQDWELRERLTFWQSRSVGEQEILRSAAAIRQAYQEEGFYFARVVPVPFPDEPHRVHLRVLEGPRAEIRSIHIKGNRSPAAPEETLKGVLASGESGLLKSRRLIPEQLEADRQRLQDFYRDHGHLRVQVEEPLVYLDAARTQLFRPADQEGPLPSERSSLQLVREPPAGDEADLYLDIPVLEGPQTRVRSLDIRGNRSLETARVREYLRLEAGRPFSPRRLRDGLNKLRVHYTESGFPNATVTAECRSEGLGRGCGLRDVAGSIVDLSLRISEGTQARLGEVFIRGNRRTLDQVILDEIPMLPGDLFDRRKLMEGQAQLRTLGLFRAIRITEIGSRPEDPRDRIALVIEVEEKEDRFLEFHLTLRGQGLDNDRSALLWGFETRYRDQNLGGRGLQLNVPLTIGNEQAGFEPGILWPRPFKLRLPTYLTVFATAENDLRTSVDVLPVSTDFTSFFVQRSFFDNYNRFRFGTELKVLLERWGLRMTPSLRIERQGERRTAGQRLCLSGTGTRAECVDFDNLVRLSAPVFFDRRDNPLHPTRGYSILLEGSWTTKLLLGENLEDRLQYLRLIGSVQGYVPLLSRRVILAGMLQYAWVVPVTQEGSNPEIPSEDLFFLGGDGKLRGYAEKSVGPRDDNGVPLGDWVRVLATAELRVHVAWWLWTAAFYDAGLLVHDPEELELSPVRHSVGVGLRLLLLELIPVRFDFAQAVLARPEDTESIFSFNLGYTF